MTSWSSWLSEKVASLTIPSTVDHAYRLPSQAAEIGNELDDFTSQLQSDTAEVAHETRETVQHANVQIAQNLELVAEKLDAAQLSESLSAVGQTLDAGQLTQRMEAVRGTVIKDLAGALTQAEESAAGLLSQGVSMCRTATEGLGSSASVSSAGSAGANSSSRHEERVRAMQSDEATFISAPADVVGFEQWSAGFELLNHTGHIEALLRDHDGLRAMHSALSAVGTPWLGLS